MELDLDLPDPQNFSDVIVFEFDRALFHTPTPNLDLLEPTSARLIETDLDEESWWVNPAILEAANDFCGQWNQELVDILKIANKTPGVFTAIVSGRTKENETQIRKMLSEQGIENVGCLIMGDARQQIRIRKSQLITTLWSHFRFANRLTVYEGRPKDARNLRFLLASLATEMRNGLIMREVVAPLVLFPPLVERQLHQDAVNRYNSSHEKQIVAEVTKQGYVHRLTAMSRQQILAKLQEKVLFQPDQVICSPANASVSAPADHADSRVGVESEWTINDVLIENGILRMHVTNVADEAEKIQIPLCGKLKEYKDGPVDWLGALDTCTTRFDIERRLCLRP